MSDLVIALACAVLFGLLNGSFFTAAIVFLLVWALQSRGQGR